MKGLTDERPKCLVTVRGRTLLDWQLTALRAAGVSEIGIVTGYRREHLADRGLREFHNRRWAETNMVSSLEQAEEWLANDACIVSYSDIFYEAAAVGSLLRSHAPMAITYDPQWSELWKKRFPNPLEDAESFRLKSDGTLAEIGFRPKCLEDIQGQYMGLLRFTPQGWEEIRQIRQSMSQGERDRMHMTGTLQKVIEAGRLKVEAIAYDGAWGEVDNEDDLGVYGT